MKGPEKTPPGDSARREPPRQRRKTAQKGEPLKRETRRPRQGQGRNRAHRALALNTQKAAALGGAGLTHPHPQPTLLDGAQRQPGTAGRCRREGGQGAATAGAGAAGGAPGGGRCGAWARRQRCRWQPTPLRREASQRQMMRPQGMSSQPCTGCPRAGSRPGPGLWMAQQATGPRPWAGGWRMADYLPGCTLQPSVAAMQPREGTAICANTAPVQHGPCSTGPGPASATSSLPARRTPQHASQWLADLWTAVGSGPAPPVGSAAVMLGDMPDAWEAHPARADSSRGQVRLWTAVRLTFLHALWCAHQDPDPATCTSHGVVEGAVQLL